LAGTAVQPWACEWNIAVKRSEQDGIATFAFPAHSAGLTFPVPFGPQSYLRLDNRQLHGGKQQLSFRE